MSTALQPVSSRAFSAVGYDEERRTLHVRFHNGAVYEYDDVPPHVWRGLQAAASKGAYLADEVKRAGYEFRVAQ